MTIGELTFAFVLAVLLVPLVDQMRRCTMHWIVTTTFALLIVATIFITLWWGNDK